jgi:hypothetical protein
VAGGHALADSQIYSYAGAAAGFLQGADVRVVGGDDDGFGGVFGEGGDEG